MGSAMWLLRIADKGRAAAAGTIYDYIYPCPMDRGVLERWHVPVDEFDQALSKHATDEALYQWFTQRVKPEDVETANAWLVSERASNLDRQDAEEGATAART